MGLFSNRYLKEGKGVDKNAPQKNAFFRFFELYGHSFSKLVIGNLLYVLFSLPVLTNGLATAGLTYVCRNAARDQHTFAASDFVETVKKNWKQSLLVGIIDLAAYAVILYDIVFAYGQLMQPEVSFWNQFYFGVSVLLLLIYRFSTYYRYFMIITFKLNLKTVFKNSFIFAMGAIGPNLVILLVMASLCAVGYFLFTAFGYFGLALILIAYITVIPSFRGYLIQYCIFPAIQKLMIDPYYKEHPDEDILLRRRLGLLPPEEDDYEEPSDKDDLT